MTTPGIQNRAEEFYPPRALRSFVLAVFGIDAKRAEESHADLSPNVIQTREGGSRTAPTGFVVPRPSASSRQASAGQAAS